MKLGPTPVVRLLAGLVVSSAHAVPSVVAGDYTNLQYISEAGDYVGLNLSVRPGPSPTVSYELCEGWCNGALVFPAEIKDRTIRFIAREDLKDQDGNPAPPIVYRVVATLIRTPSGRRLVVTSPDNREFHEVLKPIARGR